MFEDHTQEEVMNEEALEEALEETLEETEVEGDEGLETEVENEESTGAEQEPTYYTQEQVESAVKARVNTFNKKLEKMKPYETAVKKISTITGLSLDALVSRLETMSDIEQAQILGITPQQLAQQRQITQATNEATARALQLQRELEEQKLVVNPKYKDFSLFKEEIYDLIDENPKLSLKQAYTLVKGEVATQAAVRDAEQRAVAKMTKSSNQRVVKPGSNVTKSGPKIDAATIAAAKKVGMDPAEYAAFSGISDLEQFEQFKSNKKR